MLRIGQLTRLTEQAQTQGERIGLRRMRDLIDEALHGVSIMGREVLTPWPISGAREPITTAASGSMRTKAPIACDSTPRSLRTHAAESIPCALRAFRLRQKPHP